MLDWLLESLFKSFVHVLLRSFMICFCHEHSNFLNLFICCLFAVRLSVDCLIRQINRVSKIKSALDSCKRLKVRYIAPFNNTTKFTTKPRQWQVHTAPPDAQPNLHFWLISPAPLILLLYLSKYFKRLEPVFKVGT